MSSDPVEDELRERLAVLSRPLAKAIRAPSFRELCQSRARAELRRLLDESGFESDTDAARQLGVDKRFLADCLTGARGVPWWLLYAFPRQGQLTHIRALLADLPPEKDERVA